jgi:hypothetical protein
VYHPKAEVGLGCGVDQVLSSLRFQVLGGENVLPEPVAVALDVDDPAVVKKPVEDSGSDHRIPEEFLPVGEALVGGDDRGAALVAMRDELEEEVGLAAVDGQTRGRPPTARSCGTSRTCVVRSASP